jgi:endonuclease/exonuclease/phosphatase family metal-dependent hydrolase
MELVSRPDGSGKAIHQHVAHVERGSSGLQSIIRTCLSDRHKEHDAMPTNIPTIRVVTLNLYARNAEWNRRREVIRAAVDRLRPDVIALQETMVTGEDDQVREILDGDYSVYHQPGRAANGWGASIASRWPMTPVIEEPLHVSDRLDDEHPWIGSLAVVRVDIPAFPPLLLAHHKPSWQRGYAHERELQAVLAARAIDAYVADSQQHVVLVGDFDDTPASSSVRFWSGWQALEQMSVCYLDAWEELHPGEPGFTLTNANPLVARGDMPLDRGRRIDYVFVRCGIHGPTMRVISCDRLFTEPVDGVWASDHFGVVADLEPAAWRSPAIDA